VRSACLAATGAERVCATVSNAVDVSAARDPVSVDGVIHTHRRPEMRETRNERPGAVGEIRADVIIISRRASDPAGSSEIATEQLSFWASDSRSRILT